MTHDSCSVQASVARYPVAAAPSARTDASRTTRLSPVATVEVRSVPRLADFEDFEIEWVGHIDLYSSLRLREPPFSERVHHAVLNHGFLQGGGLDLTGFDHAARADREVERDLALEA